MADGRLGLDGNWGNCRHGAVVVLMMLVLLVVVVMAAMAVMMATSRVAISMIGVAIRIC